MTTSESPAAGGAPAAEGAAESAVEIAVSAERAGAAAERAAELWGAEIERAGDRRFRLRLAVVAGLRRGWVTGELRIEPTGAIPAGSRVVFRPEGSEYRLQTAAVGILVMAALGAIPLTLWPFFPALLPLAMIGVVLGLSAWFLVLSRLHSSGPPEFLEAVAEAAAGEGDAEPPGGA